MTDISFNRELERDLETLQANGQYRKLQPSENHFTLDFSRNDYLGLANDSRLYQRFLDEQGLTLQHAMSSSASRLLSGSAQASLSLENMMISAYQRPCLLFNSGYHSNISVLSVLAGKKDLIIADKLVHASLIDGIRLSGANLQRYPHNQLDKLQAILTRTKGQYRRTFIVSESIFSMDGDIADISRLVELKNQYQAILYIDEAHGVGTRGNNGLGLCEELGVLAEVDILVGAFGKALASVGGYVVCNETIKNYLVNHARPLIYSTALPPINLAWSAFIFKQLPDMSGRRKKLTQLSMDFANELGQPYQSNIIPYVVGENQDTLALSQQLAKHSIHALPIRYPTVPKNSARLRFPIRADMQAQDLTQLAQLILSSR